MKHWTICCVILFWMVLGVSYRVRHVRTDALYAQGSSSQVVTVSSSGQQVRVPNTIQNSTSVEFDYAITGSPATLNIVVAGQSSTGGITVLDTYSSTTNATRTVSLSATNYSNFVLLPTWTGGNNVSVTITIKGTGPGPSPNPSSSTSVGKYVAAFTSTTSLSVPAATHGLGVSAFNITIYDSSTGTRNRVEPASIQVDASGNVTVNFATAQSGQIVIE